ncbi:MAG TPA: HNH endonuclease [Tepidisphaeraceae bacterium]|jgi:hypothetical protein
MAGSVERAIRQLANGRCEYCQLPELPDSFKHVLDHVIARQHHGEATRHNLALCCVRCNAFKGPNLTGIDPISKRITPLFHPRQDIWSEHFRYEGPILVGLTDKGRATVAVLSINLPVRVAARHALMESGLWSR